MFDTSNDTLAQIKTQVSKLLSHPASLLQVVLLLTGLFSITYGGWQELWFQANKNSVVVSESDSPEAASKEGGQELVVDVSGAVKKPGIYAFELGTRLGQVIAAAGGLEETADFTVVAQQLNMAELVTDEQKVFVPVKDLVEEDRALDLKEQGKISINTGTKNELMDLEGIGEKRAEQIIEHRPYQNLDQLLERQVVGSAIFETILPQISL